MSDDHSDGGVAAMWELVKTSGNYLVYRVERECLHCGQKWLRTVRIHCNRVEQEVEQADSRETDGHVCLSIVVH